MSTFIQGSCIPTPVVEQSSLSYTLLEGAPIKWEQFDLVIRSLHSYKLISFDKDEESKTITVTVAYFANANNARRRLGKLSNYVGVSRESCNVQKDELQTLQQLRREFGFGKTDDDEECTSSKPAKKRRYANRD